MIAPWQLALDIKRAIRDFRYPRSGSICSFGPRHPDKTFYVITREGRGAGFLSNFHHVMLHIEIALSAGLEPVIDMQTYRTHYNERRAINGTYNAWEYFFKQPNGVSLSDVYASKNVLMARPSYPKGIDVQSPDLLNDISAVRRYSELIERYMPFNSVAQSFIDDACNKVLPNDGTVIAVMSRGTDYRNKRPSQHPIQPEPEMLLAETRRIMAERDIRYCFLKTEEKFVEEMFARSLGDRLLLTDRVYFDDLNKSENIARYTHDRDDTKYHDTLEYLRDVVIASRCDYLLSGLNNGCSAAVEFNGGRYIEKYLLDLGRYE